MKLFIVLSLLISSLMSCSEKIEDNVPVTMLQIHCDGSLTSYSSNGTLKHVGKQWLGDTPRGFLFGYKFLAIDDAKFLLTDLSMRTETFLIDNNKLTIDANYKPWQIGYVDKEKVIFSAIFYEQNVSLEKQRRHYFLYQLNQNSNSIEKLNIHNCGSANFSVLNDVVYYSGEDGFIYKYHKGRIQPLEIKGKNPSISPDGSKIAYSSFGLIKVKVNIYDFNSKKKTTILKLGEIWPIIRWSKNNNFIAVKKRSDISSNTLYVVDVLEGKVIDKLKNNHACNWFFDVVLD